MSDAALTARDQNTRATGSDMMPLHLRFLRGQVAMMTTAAAQFAPTSIAPDAGIEPTWRCAAAFGWSSSGVVCPGVSPIQGRLPRFRSLVAQFIANGCVSRLKYYSVKPPRHLLCAAFPETKNSRDVAWLGHAPAQIDGMALR